VAYLIQNPKAPNQEIHELRFGANTIGRELDNTIVVMHKSLSRHHAKLTIADDGVTIADLGSRNHTFVNEANINQCELQDGDLVRCGSVVFKFLQALETSEQEPLRNEDSNLSILKSFIPEKTNVQIQDLLHEESLKHQGTVLKLRQQDANQRTVDKLKILLEVSKQLSSPEELDKLLEKVLALLFTIMDVDRAVILLLDRKTGQLERKAAKFRSGIPTDDRFYSTTIANSVQQNAKALLITDAHVDQRFNTSYSILKQAIHASMCVPLKPREQVIGVLYADNLSMANVYSEEDLEFLIALANQAAIAIENAELSNKIQSAAVMQAKLERFFPQSVSKKLKEEGSLDIVDTEVTALFADITGFTELCSRMEPRFVIEMLNEYFQVMVEDIVFQYEGTLEKYIGDALLAVWGAPYQQPDDADRAVQAAIAMQRALAQLNEQWKKRRNLQIQIHIGLNTGKVAAGNIGSPKLVQYGTIGDTTNVSSRICSAAKPGEILISQSTLDKLRDPSLLVEKIPPVLVKGKNQPLQLYRLLWDV
jgi:adenylate cyclase